MQKSLPASYLQLIMSTLSKAIRTEISKEDQEDLLKKLLHQHGKSLLIYPEGSHISLLTALAETIHTNQETLHQKLTERLQQDLKDFTLPRRLSYIYDDPSIVQDFKKYPQLVNFVKIILQLFSASTERRINIYFLTFSGEALYTLSCKIVNEGGYVESISIAKIDNKYYNIQDREFSTKHELSLEDVFKSAPHIDSEELIETFKPESPVVQEREEKNVPEETKSSGKPCEDLQPDLMLKRVKSSMPFQNQQKIAQDYEFDKSSRNETMSLREETQLINECGPPGNQQFEGYHNMGVISQEQMYYLYYQNQFYPQKSENYMNYQQMQMHSMSPGKSSNYKVPAMNMQSVPNYYANNNYSQPLAASSPTSQSNNENKRYTGRLKFFDDAKNYGFIIRDSDESDIFVHYDDLQKAGITKEVIKTVKNDMYMQIRFNFKVMEYFGKYKKSRKAVELIIIDDELSLLSNGYPLPQ